MITLYQGDLPQFCVKGSAGRCRISIFGTSAGVKMPGLIRTSGLLAALAAKIGRIPESVNLAFQLFGLGRQGFQTFVVESLLGNVEIIFGPTHVIVGYIEQRQRIRLAAIHGAF